MNTKRTVTVHDDQSSTMSTGLPRTRDPLRPAHATNRTEEPMAARYHYPIVCTVLDGESFEITAHVSPDELGARAVEKKVRQRAREAGHPLSDVRVRLTAVAGIADFSVEAVRHGTVEDYHQRAYREALRG